MSPALLALAAEHGVIVARTALPDHCCGELRRLSDGGLVLLLDESLSDIEAIAFARGCFASQVA
ncbi:hypothetical protein [Streptomyces sp. WAC00469]|uniref:hypothetical protein n=1 Tax=Streptomyces sp. WAC00469 TaxID=2487415 RepID=UPI000F735A6A|nr:hypothetical protein [Streptomyces sp. WAC00469]RSR95431.1 hypothetical protein EF917_25720 [Streptomyces sp. WAC00469]